MSGRIPSDKKKPDIHEDIKYSPGQKERRPSIYHIEGKHFVRDKKIGGGLEGNQVYALKEKDAKDKKNDNTQFVVKTGKNLQSEYDHTPPIFKNRFKIFGKGKDVRLISRFSGKDFSTYLNNNIKDKPEMIVNALELLKSAFEEVKLLHESGFYHNDLKMDQFITDGKQILLTDFETTRDKQHVGSAQADDDVMQEVTQDFLKSIRGLAKTSVDKELIKEFNDKIGTSYPAPTAVDAISELSTLITEYKKRHSILEEKKEPTIETTAESKDSTIVTTLLDMHNNLANAKDSMGDYDGNEKYLLIALDKFILAHITEYKLGNEADIISIASEINRTTETLNKRITNPPTTHWEMASQALNNVLELTVKLPMELTDKAKRNKP